MAAVVDTAGRILGTEGFPATPEGYAQLLRWMHRHGRLVKVGVEGTGSYGAGLARHLAGEGVAVVEVNRPNRQTRRRGKSDPTDAEAAARAVLNGEAEVAGPPLVHPPPPPAGAPPPSPSRPPFSRGHAPGARRAPSSRSHPSPGQARCRGPRGRPGLSCPRRA
jgi:hypothetical protein